mgnify:FL=1
MENLERPLTWGLAIVIMGYLFIANCECGEGAICPVNSAFNISSSGINANALEVDVPETVTEVTIEDGDAAVAIETSDDGTDVSVEIETEGE